MDQDNEIAYDSVDPVGKSPVMQVDTSGQNMPDILKQATEMANQGGKGKNADAAQQWLLNQVKPVQEGQTPQETSNPDEIPFESVQPVSSKGHDLEYDQVKPVTPKEEQPTSVMDQPTVLGQVLRFGKEFSQNKQEDVLQAVGNLRSYFNNFSAKHETVDAGMITPQQKAAAKLLGMDLGGSPTWGNIYKMSPSDREEADKKFQEGMGLHPEETKKRLEKTTSGDLTEFDPFGKFLNDSLVTHGLTSFFNPQLAQSKKYHEVQDMVQNMDAVQHPEKYSPEFVKHSADKIMAYKKMNETGTLTSLKEMGKEAIKEPLGTAKGLAAGILSDPELMLAPEAKLGTSLAGARELRAGLAAKEASRLRDLAASVRGAAAETPGVSQAASRAADVYARVGQRAEQAGKLAKAQRHVGDVLGTAGAGAAINATTEAASQEADQGYVRQGSLEAPAVTGAAFGVVGHAIGGLRGGKGDLNTDLADRAQPKPVIPEEQHPGNINEGRRPGEPLHPDTPISKDGNVPYFGGVDANMDRIHLHEDAPEQVPLKNRKGQDVNVPIHQTVGYHEAVEAPLMHMEGPIDDDILAEIQQRIGPNKKLPPKTIEKLKRGESLVYTNPEHEATDPGAHEIATWAENHMVHTLYDVDPKVYQDSLKPYIKEIGKTSQKPGAAADIPDTLDTKPYDDVHEGDQLEGQGARPAVDQVEPGAKPNEDNKAKAPWDQPAVGPEEIAKFREKHPELFKESEKGKIDPRLLATGVATTGGALAGTLLPGDKEKNALLGGIAGLATSALMWGGVRPEGMGKREAGMFAGPGSRGYRLQDEQMARRMEKIGKDPEAIWQATGMAKGPSGQWYREIPDNLMEVKDSLDPVWKKAQKEPIPLSEVVSHDRLQEEYPGILDKVKIKVDLSLGALGSYNPQTKLLTLSSPAILQLTGEKQPWKSPRSVIAHELQHYIQAQEGMPGGASVAYMAQQAQKSIDYLYNRSESLFQQIQSVENGEPHPQGKTVQDLVSEYEKVNKKIGEFEKKSPTGRSAKAEDLYAREAGEVQARNTQTRLRMTEEERAAKSPFQTQDYPNREQVINKESGFADPELVKRMARAAVLGTVGASIGMRLADPDDKWKGALAGAGLAVLSGPILSDFAAHPIEATKRAFSNFKQSAKAPPKENINDSVSRWQELGLHAEVMGYRVDEALKRAAPTKASRIKVTQALDTGNTKGLTPGEKRAYDIARQHDDELGQLAQKEGVIPQLINNHISHIWRNDAKLKAYQQLVNSQIIANMSPKTAFATARQIKSIAQGKAMGLTPVTEDAMEILSIYRKSVLNAIRNKQLLDGLKSTKDASGQSYLVQPARKAPYNYVPINHPQLRGLAVHPTIAPELRNIFYTYDLGPVQTWLSTINMALKRSQVSFSLFHLTSLMDAFTGGMPTFTKPVSTVGTAMKSMVGKSDFHEALRGNADPATQQLFNRFLASGARPQIAKGSGADVDLNNNYYEGLRHMQDYLDRAMPGVGRIAPQAVAAVSHAMDKIIFENGMSGMKFALWNHAVDKLNTAWAKEAQKNPSLKVPEQKEIDRMAGGYVNNLLGSQNWLQAAQQATTSIGKGYLNALGSPIGRKISQYLMFAPDWTTSTVMSFTKALGKGSEQFGTGIGKIGKAIEGLNNPKTVADLHRIYQIRSAMLYALIGGAINYAYSGHYIWENKDPTTIDLGNGQRLQWNKHWTEPYDIMRRPAQAAVNKAGIYPKEVMDQLLKKEYINTEGYSPEMKDRLGHAAKNLVPIPFQGLGEQTPQQLMWNLAGRNVIGHPTATKEWQEKEHQRRSESAKKAAEKRAQKRMNELYGG